MSLQCKRKSSKNESHARGLARQKRAHHPPLAHRARVSGSALVDVQEELKEEQAKHHEQ